MNSIWLLRDFAPGEGSTAEAYSSTHDEGSWVEVAVPGDVHTALLAAGRIADPFYDRNEHDCAWIEEREWWYRGVFDGPSQPLASDERIQLVFSGLDTFATVWLNGSLLGSHTNMFREATFDVTAVIQLGQPNTIAVRFDRPTAQPSLQLADNWAMFNTERTSFRKAQFGYGWDWGPRLPTVGIWRPVEVRRERTATIRGIHCVTRHLDVAQLRALVEVSVEVEAIAPVHELVAQVHLTPPNATVPSNALTLPLTATGSLFAGRASFALEQAHLWWTHDLGMPARYTLEVKLEHNGQVIEEQRQHVGIRTIALDQSADPDEPGTRFFRFVLNGIPIFAKGACWIPCDSFVGAIPPERYQTLLTAARDGNMNMLRVWGGGIYEHDVFYELCDELGILVWQDFMFSCAPYPDHDTTFTAEVEAEAIYQVRRLRNHPSLALWCGNNENQWIHDTRHWSAPETLVPGTRFYDEILPRVVEQHDAQTPYWPGSPFGGNDHNSMDEGDRHNWDVWHGNRPFERRFGERPYSDQSVEGVAYTNYALDRGRFISEFGMHAAPVLSTLQRVIPPDQLYHHSPSLDHHNKDTPKNKGDHLMATVTGLPSDLREYIDFSMIAQAEGLKFAIEHYRRRKPHCSGTLFWQLNDCWPTLSWSVLDYYGVGKAGYYYAKRAYAPVLASFKAAENGAVELWLTNDTLHTYNDVLCVQHGTFTGEVEWTSSQFIQVAANSSQMIAQWNADALHASPRHYLGVRSTQAGFPDNRHFFAPIKDLARSRTAPTVHLAPADDGTVVVHIAASAYAYFVHLWTDEPGTQWSDNYFDVWPGETRQMTVSGRAGSDLTERIHVSWC